MAEATFLIPVAVGLSTTILAMLAALRYHRRAAITARARRLRAAGEWRANAIELVEARIASWLAALLARLDLDGAHARRTLVNRLAQAGIRDRAPLAALQGAWLIMPVATMLAAYLLAPLFLDAVSPARRLMVAACGIGIGAFAPRLWLINRTQKRQALIHASLPDALDLYVICVEAGLGLDTAMHRVGREFRHAAPEVSDELTVTAIELSLLPNRNDAFANLLRRVPSPTVQALITMFQQTERYGTPLVNGLRTLVEQLRTEQLLSIETRAARLPAVLSVPMIAFILPPLFVVLIGPAALRMLAIS